MTVFTIGFTKKSAEVFFTKLQRSGAKRVIDIRLNNVSQLAGFTKRDDLSYFLREICEIEYIHLPEFAPSKEILDKYKKNRIDWSTYEIEFLELLKNRGIENTISRELIHEGCLLCSEPKPNKCHRRLVAEYLKERWGDLEIVHIM